MLKSLDQNELGFSRCSIGEGGAQGVCLLYVAGSRAVYGVGTLWPTCLQAENRQALAPAYVAKCHSFSIEKPLAYLLKGRMAEKDVDKLDANKTQTERKQFPAHGSRRCKARFWLR